MKDECIYNVCGMKIKLECLAPQTCKQIADTTSEWEAIAKRKMTCIVSTHQFHLSFIAFVKSALHYAANFNLCSVHCRCFYQTHDALNTKGQHY